MENIQNNKLKTALEDFLNNPSKNTFTFGAAEIYASNNITLSESDAENLFNELIANKDKVHELYLNGVGLTKIPKTIGQLSKLTFLSLIYNKIENVPHELCNLKKIKSLSLSNNKIINLPEHIGNMTQLTHIYLSNNPIENLPDSINNLHNLEVLNLMQTGIKKTDVNKIKQLENLCKNTVYNSYGNKKDAEFYKNPKIYIDDIGSNRSQLKNVLSKYDFDHIIRGISYQGSPKTKTTKKSRVATKRNTPYPSKISRSSSKSSTKKERTSTSIIPL